MTDDLNPTTDEIRRLQKAITAQEDLRGIMPDEQIDGQLASLQKQLVKLQQAVADRGSAIAQEGGTAVGEGGINNPGTIGGHAVTGHGNVVADEYHHHDAPPSPNPGEKALKRYLSRLYHRCNALPLAAMGGEDATGRTILLERVYVELDTNSPVPRTALVSKPSSDAERFASRPHGIVETFVSAPSPKLTALEAATQTDRLVLLGDPGGGKSSFVRQLAAWLSAVLQDQKPAPEDWQPLLPLLIYLRDLSPRLAKLELSGMADDAQDQALRDTVMALWTEQLAGMDAADLAEDLPDWLDRGDVLLIFDGLDEVPVNQRPGIRRALHAVLSEHGQVQKVIVTCRSRSYSGDSVLPHFTAHTLAGFSEEKVSQFIRGWYVAQVHLGRLTGDEASDRAADLIDAARDDDLMELSSNPMLLTTMAIIHQQEVGLPKERVRLYDQAVQVLLRRWHKRKGLALPPGLEDILDDERRLRAILNRLAYEAHLRQSKQDAGDLARPDLLALLEQPDQLGDIKLAADFLDYVDQRSGLLVGRGGGEAGQPALYAFPHRTFQEYLAGCYLVSGRNASRALWQHVQEGDFWYLAAQLGSEELLYNGTGAGKNTYLDLAYDLLTGDPPATLTEWRALIWSGRMASLLDSNEIVADSKPGGGQTYLNRLTDRLPQALSSDLPPAERAEAGRVLGRLGDPRRAVMDVDAMPFCLVPAGPFCMGSPDGDPDARDDEKPLHEVDIPYDYWIGRYPVTNAQYRTFVEDGGYGQSSLWPEAEAAEFWRDGRFKGFLDNDWRVGPYQFRDPFGLSNHPVVGVSWYEALAFTRWLTARWREAGLLSEDLAVVLPSEAEWEKVARGGKRIPEEPRPLLPGNWQTDMPLIDNPLPQRRYPWGDAWEPGRANGKESGIGSTSAVGVYPGQGNVHWVDEVSGNTFEWTRSVRRQYEHNPGDGREDISQVKPDDWIAIRGGYFGSDSTLRRCAARSGDYPDYWYYYLGFRVMVSPFLITEH